jgi:ribonuclease HII
VIILKEPVMMESLFAEEQAPTLWHFENLVRRQGFRQIAGIDEAGRGPLAGPVVAAAVILPAALALPGVNDSKKLPATARERLYAEIMSHAMAVGIGSCDAGDVDRINILQATLKAMQQAVRQLATPPDYLLIDGISAVPLNIPQKSIKKGDSLSISIAAASIVAKVTRDRLMVAYDREFPGYGFASHKGYGCETHLRAIAAQGPCPIHRRTFRGVREHLGDGE